MARLAIGPIQGNENIFMCVQVNLECAYCLVDMKQCVGVIKKQNYSILISFVVTFSCYYLCLSGEYVT